MTDQRVMFTVVIRTDGEVTGMKSTDLAVRIRDALNAAGVPTDGVAVASWQTWESVAGDARDGCDTEGLTDEEQVRETKHARWACEKFDGMEFEWRAK